MPIKSEIRHEASKQKECLSKLRQMQLALHPVVKIQ